jgi:RNA polymerase sigma factor (sigma-70 family)
MSDPGSLMRLIRQIAPPADSDATDGRLLARFISRRDEAAFTALVARHGPMVLGVCRRVLHNAHDAEDAFQAVFLVLARKLAAIREPELLGNWLYGVAFRTALEARTKNVNRRARERSLAEISTVDHSSAIVSSDLRNILDDEINRLPDKYRAPFVLCYLEGRTNEQAAHLLGRPKGTILSRLAWARQRLRHRLTRRGVTLSAAAAGAVLSADSLSAAVPAELASGTGHAALLFAGGQAAAPAEVITLAEGVLRAMFIAKLKIASVALLAAVILGGGLAWVGQQTWASSAGQSANPVADTKADELVDTLFTMEKQGWEATRRKDAASLRKVHADDFVAILADGSRLTRDEYFAVFPLFEIKSYSLSDAKLLALGPDAAILTYKADTETVILGETEKGQTQVSSTWVRRDGKWMNVFYQETEITE